MPLTGFQMKELQELLHPEELDALTRYIQRYGEPPPKGARPFYTKSVTLKNGTVMHVPLWDFDGEAQANVR